LHRQSVETREGGEERRWAGTEVSMRGASGGGEKRKGRKEEEKKRGWDYLVVHPKEGVGLELLLHGQGKWT